MIINCEYREGGIGIKAVANFSLSGITGFTVQVFQFVKNKKSLLRIQCPQKYSRLRS